MKTHAKKKTRTAPKSSRRSVIDVTPKLLKAMALPEPGGSDDKESRGRIFVVAGSREMPGAAVLAATAALRAGAGKLLMACPESIAQTVAGLLPESCVVEIPEARNGSLKIANAEKHFSRAKGTHATLIGPGMAGGASLVRLIERLAPVVEAGALVLDAEALSCLRGLKVALRRFDGRVIITPHSGELASMLNINKEAIEADPEFISRDFALKNNLVVVLKGAETFIANPDGDVYRYHGANAGLGTSGSGDTLAGIIAGLAARGAPPVKAAIWGVAAHAKAGDLLAREIGGIGFLAREILPNIPVGLAQLSKKPTHPASARR